ncbi:hypothetical protein DFQ29_007487 [Apophysomyces sp. BC1021]|nr:hypothetical protein DFQ29_007487 [Apophysomyces sp. BC1021]
MLYNGTKRRELQCGEWRASQTPTAGAGSWPLKAKKIDPPQRRRDDQKDDKRQTVGGRANFRHGRSEMAARGQLCDHTGWDQDVMKKLEVVGYLDGGTV